MSTGNKLLSRGDFREKVFARDRYRCVFCDSPAVDAHHIIERRLWGDGGYYLDNGASVCGDHHLQCEQTVISVEEIRRACGISRILLPRHLFDNRIYDKWGNPVLPDGHRLKGELFLNENAQKVLGHGGMLGLFLNRFEHPRTHHLPWSEGLDDGDPMIESMCQFAGKRVVITKKIGIESMIPYQERGRPESAEDLLSPNENNSTPEIPEGWRICGENSKTNVAPHGEARNIFVGATLWNEKNICLSWGETTEWLGLLGITLPTVLFDGVFDETASRNLSDDKHLRRLDGYTMRCTESFEYGEYRHKVAKFVSAG